MNAFAADVRLDNGIVWLKAHQSVDGGWGIQNRLRDTATVIDIYRLLGVADESYQRATDWVVTTSVESNDYLARRIMIRFGAGFDVTDDLERLVACQNPSGGWGYSRNFGSNVYDTALALQALQAAHYKNATVISKAITFLVSKQNADGSWSSVPEAAGDVTATSLAILALKGSGSGVAAVPLALTAGLNWLQVRQYSDGGFGNAFSTIHETAQALQALMTGGVLQEAEFSAALQYVTSNQLADGSWNESAFETALAIRVLNSVKPNLSIFASDIALSSLQPRSGERVTIHATVRNTGGAGAVQVPVRIWAEASNQPCIELITTSIASLPMGGAVAVDASFDTRGREGAYTIFVALDQDQTLNEINRVDNQADMSLRLVPIADLSILASNIALSKATVSIGEDLAISATITNEGNAFAQNIPIAFFCNSVAQDNFLGSALVSDLSPGGSATRQILWKTNQTGPAIRLYAVIDYAGSLSELTRENNQAFRTINISSVTGPNLSVSYKDMHFTPSPAMQNGSVEISGLVRNQGYSASGAVEVAFYKGVPGVDGVLLGSTTLPDIPSGGAVPVAFTWVNIKDSGEKIIYMQVDPDQEIVEFDETDNDAFLTLSILNLPDLAISTNSVIFSPAAPKEGDTVAINITVKNLGEQQALNVPVGVYEDNTTLGLQVIPVLTGNSQVSLSVPYATTGKKGPHRITVSIDPENIITEQNEENNQAVKNLGVQNSNLWVTEPFISPNGDGMKDSTQFFFRLESPETIRVIIVDKEGKSARTYTDQNYENTSGGNATWDGLDDAGLVVDDGVYQFEILNQTGAILGKLPVVVDNNRSFLAEALGTKYLLNNNLTCALPDSGNWQWLPDESGIIINIDHTDPSTPEYPAGIYTVSSDGEDVIRLVPWETDPQYSSVHYSYDLAPNGEKIAFIINKYFMHNWYGEYLKVNELWTVNIDGTNLKRIGSQEYDFGGRPVYESIKWTPDNAHLLYYGEDENVSAVWAVNSDGSGKFKFEPGGADADFYRIQFSPDGERALYSINIFDPESSYETRLRVTDLAGNRQDLLPLNSNWSSYDWLDGKYILLNMIDPDIWRDALWLVDSTQPGHKEKITDYLKELAVCRDKKLFAYIAGTAESSNGSGGTTLPGKWSIRLGDASGNSKLLYEAPAFRYTNSLYDLRLSKDGSKVAFIDNTYYKIDDCHYEPYLVIINLLTLEKKVLKASEAIDVCEIPSSYHIETPDGTVWAEQGVLHYDSAFKTRQLDLTNALRKTENPYRIRLTQRGLDAAHIDYAVLSVNGREYKPVKALNLTRGENILGKITALDHDVADAHEATIELVFENVPQSGSKYLVLNAREEDLNSRKAVPFRFPATGSYTITLKPGTPLEADGILTDSDDLPEPLFKTYARPVTGHPAGYTYGYVKCTSEYLYGVLDFTSDNTIDSGRDWAAMEVITATGPKSFVVNTAKQTYGRTSFTYTDKVNYQHNVYEFKVPLSELGVQSGSPVQVSFQAYGTAGASDGLYYSQGSLQWLGDNVSLLATDNHGIFSVYARTGAKVYLPIDGYLSAPSPDGRFITYERNVDPDSACYGRGYWDYWAMSSLLNLTADLKIKKEKSAVLLKGTAVDLHFSGYKLEYADVKTPSLYNLLNPPSDIPVLNNVLATWVPPYEGTFYVKLTVWDEAGNTATARKRVSWGMSASVTNIYKSYDIFSPNGDNIRDTVELHYRIVEPVHLEFYIYDSQSLLVKTIMRDYTSPQNDFISWDGRDESGRRVPDGKYTIRLFDYEFAVEIDTVQPENSLFLSPLTQSNLQSNSDYLSLRALLLGHALDKNLKKWTIEYGEGENPLDWYEFMRGEGELVNRDPDWVAPFTGDSKDTTITRIYNPDGLMGGASNNLEWLVNKKLRMRVEDYAGNMVTDITNRIKEQVVLYQWDETTLDLGFTNFGNVSITPGMAKAGIHTLKGVETILLPNARVAIQYSQEYNTLAQQWLNWKDAGTILQPPSGIMNLSWDTSVLDPNKSFAVRIRVLDTEGHIFDSNYIISNVFSLEATCGVFPVSPGNSEQSTSLTAKNYQPNRLQTLVIQVRSGDDKRYQSWTPYFVLDTTKGDEIPLGEFNPPLPSVLSGMSYEFKMIGLGAPGSDCANGFIESKPASYPPNCSNLKLQIDYEKGECDFLSHKAVLSTELENWGPRQFTKLSYYMEKQRGKPELIEEFNLDNNSLPALTFDRSVLPEGRYPVYAVLSFINLVDRTADTLAAKNILIVDRTPPLATLTYPDAAQTVCPVRVTGTDEDWYGIAVEGLVKDNTAVKSYALYYSMGDEITTWSPARTRKGKNSIEIKDYRECEGQLGVWDISKLPGETFWLKLKVTDAAGNVSCALTHFSVDNRTEISALTTDKSLFSPNGDGNFDEVRIDFQIDEYATVDVKAYPLSAGQSRIEPNAIPASNIVLGNSHFAGTDSLVWNGNGINGTAVPDGRYGVMVSITDACGNLNRKWVPVEIDNTPPAVSITSPVANGTFGNIIEVKGSADDLHFQNYLLEAGEGNAPEEWRPISSGTASVDDGVLGKWNTFGLEGKWTLRLTAFDRAGNKQDTSVTIDPGIRPSLIKDFDLVPALFSPNADGKLDTSTFKYELTDICHIKLEILNVINNTPVIQKTYTADSVPAGIATMVWDGTNTGHEAVKDGAYTVRLTATRASLATDTQTETLTVMVDTVPPAINLAQPVADFYYRSIETLIAGSISDQHLQEYTVTYSDQSGNYPVDQGNQSRSGYTFGTLSELPDGHYTVHVKALDQAQNSMEKDIPFVIDRIPPKLTLDNPLNGTYYGSAKDQIQITGGLVEENLANYAIRYGMGDKPEQWQTLKEGTSLPAQPEIYTWAVGKGSGVSDGTYTLSFMATDKAGAVSEIKVKVTIDNTAPVVAFTAPQENNYIKSPVEISGTASDLTLDTYTVELAEGNSTTATQWVPIKKSTGSVQEGVLAVWSALPEDGDYCLRLSAIDKLDNTAEARINVKVDTHPPTAPALSGKTAEKVNTALDWTANMEPDLAGYNLYRDNTKINSALLMVNTYLDANLEEGDYTYTVKAVDLAGWESAASDELKIKVDKTGPEVRIRSPQDGARVSDIVDIKGTAFSPDDFKQYRLYAGQENGSGSVTWTLLRSSPIPIGYGLLAQWDTILLSEGQYLLKLEAEDLLGNISSHQVAVLVDNTPPAQPVLQTALPDGSDCTLNWLVNTETDLAGYLLYRNDQLANSQDLVVKDLKPYILSGTNTSDKALPDGHFRYYLLAIDLAGNMSEPSNTLEVTIDTHPPHAVIITPEAQSAFDKQLLIKAETPDLDINTIQFQYKRTIESTWQNLAAPLTQVPYIAYLDPVATGLVYGNYQLQAIATDVNGKTDLAPASITVTYADITPPAAPSGLKALTLGDNVTLTWQANTEQDLDGYNVYKTVDGNRIKLNTTVQKAPSYLDTALPDGLCEYEITAVDLVQNESAASGTVLARVYAPVIAQPYTPVGQNTIQVKGEGAAANSTVDITVEPVTGTGNGSHFTTPADEHGRFTADVILTKGENRIMAQAIDKEGNTSKAAEAVLVVYNEPPAAPAGLTVTVHEEKNAALAWIPNNEADLAGYLLYRNSEKYYSLAPVSSGAGTCEASSSNYYNPAAYAFDGDPATSWVSETGYGSFEPVWWEISLTAPELVTGLKLLWTESDYAGRDYEVQVWTGHAWLTSTTMTGNTLVENTVNFRPAYRTDKIRIRITAVNTDYYYMQTGLAEVTLYRETLLPAAPTAYDDTNLADGSYRYTLTAVDIYGAESQPSGEQRVNIGDVVAPQAPAGLTTHVTANDLSLTWEPNTETDLAGYWIYRKQDGDWVKINTTLLANNQFEDPGLANGTYMYKVTATDAKGNESLPSAVVTVTIAVPDTVAPASPVLFYPTTAGTVLSLSRKQTALAGTAEPGSLVELYKDGLSQGQVIALASPSVHDITLPEDEYDVTPSPDGKQLAYVADDALWVKDLVTGASKQVQLNAEWPVWSPDGTKLAYVWRAEDWTSHVFIYNRETALSLPVTNDTYADEYSPSWTADSRSLAIASNRSGTYQVWLKDLLTGTFVQFTDSPVIENPLVAPDGRKVAYFDNQNLYIYDNAGARTMLVSDQANQDTLTWSSESSRLLFSSSASGYNQLYVYDVAHESSVQLTQAATEKLWGCLSPDAHSILYAEQAVDDTYSIVLQSVDAVSGQVQTPVTILKEHITSLNYLSWMSSGRIAYQDGNTQSLLALQGYFRFKDVALDSGENNFHAVAVDASGNVSRPSEPVVIRSDYSLLPDLEVSEDDIYLYPALPVTGQKTTAHIAVWNKGLVGAEQVNADIYLTSDTGKLQLLKSQLIPFIAPETSEMVGLTWNASAQAETNKLLVVLDAGNRIPECTETNNSAAKEFTVIEQNNIRMDLSLLVASVGINQNLPVELTLVNGGMARSGTLDIMIQDEAGYTVAVLKSSQLELSYGAAAHDELVWNTGLTLAGSYKVHAQYYSDTGIIAQSTEVFTLLPDIKLASTIVTDKVSYKTNENANLTVTINNFGYNAVLDDLEATVIITDNSGLSLYAHTNPVPALTPGSVVKLTDFWNTATHPEGAYNVMLSVRNAAGTLLTSGKATLTIKNETNPALLLKGQVSLEKQRVLSGEPVLIKYTVNNIGTINLNTVVLSFLVVPANGQTPVDVLTEQVTLPAEGSNTGSKTLATNGYTARDFLVILRAKTADKEMTLAGTYFRVEGAPTAPSLNWPANRQDIETLTPALIVNNASDPNDDILTCQFELYRDSGLSQLVATSGMIVPGNGTTSWAVPALLTENETYYWRARVYDGMLYGEWMALAAFRVNVANDSPTAPVLSAPADNTVLDSFSPVLTVLNATDPDSSGLTYNFQVARDSNFTDIVASAVGVTEGNGTTSYQLPVVLEQNITYYWRAQADDWLVEGPWMQTARFVINKTNQAPAAPVILTPVNASEITALNAEIVIQNSLDADSNNLTYRFEIDTVATFDSPQLRLSGPVQEGQETTQWPVNGLQDNTWYYARAKASDGQAESPWSAASKFFVNAANDRPATPVLANPSIGSEVRTYTPTLSVHNASDIDHDSLMYEFELYQDASFTKRITSATAIAELPDITSWVVPVSLTENQTYFWRARAYDGELYSDWMTTGSFTVNTANDAPGAPALQAPVQGISIDTIAPVLSVFNAVDQDSDRLTYTFEVYEGGTLISSTTGVEENNSGITSLTLSAILKDNATYNWRARAYDGDRYGAWMELATFTVHLPGNSITATIDVDPNTINKKSCGQWVTVYIELPKGYCVKDIKLSSLRLEGQVPAEIWPWAITDHDRDGIWELMVKFRRSKVADILPLGDKVLVHVSGKVKTTTFEGVDTIRVIR